MSEHSSFCRGGWHPNVSSSDCREENDERMRTSDTMTSAISENNSGYTSGGEPNHARHIFVKGGAFRTWVVFLNLTSDSNVIISA